MGSFVNRPQTPVHPQVVYSFPSGGGKVSLKGAGIDGTIINDGTSPLTVNQGFFKMLFGSYIGLFILTVPQPKCIERK